MVITNMFKSKKDEEVTKELVQDEKIRQEMHSLEGLAKDMLQDQRYKMFREGIERLLGQALRALIAYQHPDNDIYAVNVRVFLQQIRDLKNFLDTPVNFLNQIEVQRVTQETRNLK